MIAAAHPLFGRLLEAVSFKRLAGVLHLVVGLPDGSPGTIPAAATNVFGDAPVPQVAGTVLSVDGIRRLRTLVEVSGADRRGSGSRGVRR